MPWSPLRGGWVSGKYTKDMLTPPENTHVAAAEKEAWSNYNNDFTATVGIT